jgi:hypothetical protein
MSLISKNKKDFSVSLKNNLEHGDNIVFVKGGATVIDGVWVNFKDLRIDVADIVQKYVEETSRRLFNHFNDILYILIAMDKNSQIEVIPSISYNKKSFGNIKIFPDLSLKLPLMVVKLTQDGSNDLKAFKVIKKGDIEVYNGYGNLTLMGDKGTTGYQGATGSYGITGMRGVDGFMGITGIQGETGSLGLAVQGVTGMRGMDGVSFPALLLDRN